MNPVTREAKQRGAIQRVCGRGAGSVSMRIQGGDIQGGTHEETPHPE